MAEEAVTKGSSATVTVACKLPHGLILRLYRMNEFDEPVLGGGTRRGKIAEQVGDEVRIKGYAVPRGMDHTTRIIGGNIGFALTPGVPRDFFEEWLRQYADLPAVKQGLIFASDKVDTIEKKVKERSKLRNGLEPIDPKNPPRVGRLKVERYKKSEDDDVAAA